MQPAPLRKALLRKVIALDLALILGAFMVWISIYVTFWLHECGHMLFGFLHNLLMHGTISTFRVTRWVDFPPIPFLRAPQQVTITNGDPSLNFALGGILLVILAWTAIACVFSWWSRNASRNWIFIVPLVFACMEILGNFLCGTDNPAGIPQPFCSAGTVQSFLETLPFALILPFTVLLYPGMRIHVATQLDRIERWKKNTQKRTEL
jgi:hypothetical protein